MYAAMQILESQRPDDIIMVTLCWQDGTTVTMSVTEAGLPAPPKIYDLCTWLQSPLQCT